MIGRADQILAELARAPNGRTVSALSLQLDCPAAYVIAACAVLHRRKLISRIGDRCYRLSAAGRALLAAGKSIRPGSALRRRPTVPPRTLRHRVWHALGNRQKATLDELLRVACAGDERDPERNIRRYLRLLERTGYLVKMRVPYPNPSQWLVVKWTGPQAPVARQSGTALYDPNLRQTLEGAAS